MFLRQHKTLWYQFCNFKHFLKAENSEDHEDSLASSCVEFSIGLSCNPVSLSYAVSVLPSEHCPAERSTKSVYLGLVTQCETRLQHGHVLELVKYNRLMMVRLYYLLPYYLV